MEVEILEQNKTPDGWSFIVEVNDDGEENGEPFFVGVIDFKLQCGLKKGVRCVDTEVIKEEKKFRILVTTEQTSRNYLGGGKT